MVAFPVTFPEPLDFVYCAIYEKKKLDKKMTVQNPGQCHTFYLEWSGSLQDKSVCILGYVRNKKDPVFQRAAKIRDLFPGQSTYPANCRLAYQNL